MDAADRQNYHEMIQSIWSGAVRSSPSQINQECVQIVNTVLYSAVQCSDRLPYTEALLRAVYGGSKPSSITSLAIKTFSVAFKGWIKSVSNDRLYQACLNSARLPWRSPIEIALLGI